MYRHILVPVDGSPTSQRGLDEAVKLAQLTGARLSLIHVLDDSVYATDMSGYSAFAADLEPMGRQAGVLLLQRYEARVLAGGIKVETTLRERLSGRLCDIVVGEATRCGADLIVLGTHGRRGIGRVLMGSDAEQIVRLAATPVLLVRAADVPVP